MNRQILLASRPNGAPQLDNFALIETEIGAPQEGQFLVQTEYLSLDPYMRARMYEGENYARNVPLGAVMIGTTVARVIESQHSNYAKGDYVMSPHGWQEFALSNGEGLADRSVANLLD